MRVRLVRVKTYAQSRVDNALVLDTNLWYTGASKLTQNKVRMNSVSLNVKYCKSIWTWGYQSVLNRTDLYLDTFQEAIRGICDTRAWFDAWNSDFSGQRPRLQLCLLKQVDKTRKLRHKYRDWFLWAKICKVTIILKWRLWERNCNRELQRWPKRNNFWLSVFCSRWPEVKMMEREPSGGNGLKVI